MTGFAGIRIQPDPRLQPDPDRDARLQPDEDPRAADPQQPNRSVMEFEEIERILELVRQHELSEFELEREGLKLRIRKATAGFPPLSAPSQIFTSTPPVAMPVAAMPPAPTAGSTPGSLSAGEEVAEEVELAVVKSPIVGTFYGSPEPGAPPFVEVGQQVKKDQVLCIIEAMKLMNEITSEYEGEIVSVYVENGKPVQYGERLFAIRTR